MRYLYIALTVLQFSWSNIRRNRLTTWVSSFIIMLILWTVGGWIIGQSWLKRIIEPYLKEIRIYVYLDPTVQNGIPEIESLLKQTPFLTSWSFVSSKEGKESFLDLFPDLTSTIQSLPENPFPPSYELHLNPQTTSRNALKQLVKKLTSFQQVTSVEYESWWIEKAIAVFRVFRVASWIGGTLLIALAIFTVANVIRLSFYARKDEMNILHLLGAPPVLVHSPFLLEGFFIGVLAGIGASIGWIIGMKLSVYYLNHVLADILLQPIPFLLNIRHLLPFIAGGGTFGLLGATSALWMIKVEHIQ